MAEKQKRQLVFLLGVALWVTWEFSEEPFGKKLICTDLRSW